MPNSWRIGVCCMVIWMFANDGDTIRIDEFFAFLSSKTMWTPYFVHPRFVCRTSKIPKILSFLHGVTEASRLMWRNPFEHQSTQSAILGQIGQNAPSQPWVDRKSKSTKSSQNNIFHITTSNSSYLVIFINFDKV